ncbi:MAG: hypothetical protein IPM49_02025 [Flavobacteriales bacterium]|nr:hypothetical protein [Flavobacteriales bacterium]
MSGLSYPTTQRLCRLPLAGGAIAPMAWNVTDVRRNAQQGGTDMLCTTTTGLRRIAQPDDASPTQTTHALPGIQPALALQPVLIGPDRSTSTRHLGRRRYELTDHLGNVRAVVGDRKLSDFSLDINTPVLVPTSFKADVLSYADYDAFGSLLDERHAFAYRFGFQGQEQDDEIHDDPGTSYAFEYRMHDARVGRFWNLDPLAGRFPHNSPYAFSENKVIDHKELEGLEGIPAGKDQVTGYFISPNDSNSDLGQWDTQVIYPQGPADPPQADPMMRLIIETVLPFSEINQLITGEDDNGHEASRTAAAGWLILASFPVSGWPNRW